MMDKVTVDMSVIKIKLRHPIREVASVSVTEMSAYELVEGVGSVTCRSCQALKP